MISIEDTMDMTLIELLTELKTIENIENFLKPLKYEVKKSFVNIIGIHYIEGMNNLWGPKWSREARGKYYYIGSTQIIELKGCLQRGAEILTKKHISSKIDQTQEMENNNASLEQFDDIQQKIIKVFQTDSYGCDIDGYVTAKVDGSLIIVNVYPVKSIQWCVMNNVIKNCNIDFNKDIAQHCYDNNLPLVTISSKGTLIVGPEMVDYFKSCINVSVDKFVNDVVNYYNELNYTNYTSFFFEGYCKGRTTINGHIYTGLAISYDHNDLLFLGSYYNQKYYPHFTLPNNDNFKQPFYKKISNTKQVYEMMNDLDDIVLGNKVCDQILHPEGFVFFTDQFSPGLYDYSKIKTIMYYQCHKIKSYNIDKLLSLPDCAGNYYPVIKKLKSLNNNLKPFLENIITKSYDLIMDEINMTSTLIYSSFKDKAKVKVKSLLEQNPNDATVFKIFINCDITILVNVFNSLTTHIPQLYIDDYVCFIKSLLMFLQPWSNSDWLKSVHNMIDTKHTIIIKLYDLVLSNGIDLI